MSVRKQKVNQIGWIITDRSTYNGELIYLRNSLANSTLIDRLTVDLQYGPSQLRVVKVRFDFSPIFPRNVVFLE